MADKKTLKEDDLKNVSGGAYFHVPGQWYCPWCDEQLLKQDYIWDYHVNHTEKSVINCSKRPKDAEYQPIPKE